MAVDSLTKRAAVLGVGRPWMRSKNPDATLSEAWRVVTGNIYPVASLSPAAPVVEDVTFFGPDEHDLQEDDQAILAIIKSYIQRVA